MMSNRRRRTRAAVARAVREARADRARAAALKRGPRGGFWRLLGKVQMRADRARAAALGRTTVTRSG